MLLNKPITKRIVMSNDKAVCVGRNLLQLMFSINWPIPQPASSTIGHAMCASGAATRPSIVYILTGDLYPTFLELGLRIFSIHLFLRLRQVPKEPGDFFKEGILRRVTDRIELIDVGISHIDFVTEVRRTTFERWIAEREAISTRNVKEGEQQKQGYLPTHRT